MLTATDNYCATPANYTLPFSECHAHTCSVYTLLTISVAVLSTKRGMFGILINSKCFIYTRSYTASPASLTATVTITSDDDDCLPAGAIVGIVLAVIIFIVLLILCIVLLLILCYCCILPLRRRGEATTVDSLLC